MPIYEYICRKCHHKFSVLLRAGAAAPSVCPRCGHQEVTRLFSVFSVRGKTDKDVYEDILGDPQLARGMLSDDPRALAEWNKRMGQGMDEETPPEYSEMLERMEKGEMPSPETIKSLKGEDAEGGDTGDEGDA